MTDSLTTPRRIRVRAVWKHAVLVAGCIAASVIAAMGADFVDGVRARDRQTGSETERTRDAVLEWRAAAWRSDDFLAAVELGHTYNDDNANRLRRGPRAAGADFGRLHDRVEAYVWYFLATRSERFTKYLFQEKGQIIIDDKLTKAGQYASSLYLRMSEAERLEARNRVTYILSCQGPDGFFRLATAYNDDSSATTPLSDLNGHLKRIRARVEVRGDDPLYKGTGLVAKQVFTTDKLAALMFLYIAHRRGSDLAETLAEAMKASLMKNGVSADIIEQVKLDARRWVPPFEFYPRGDGLYPHTDECMRSAEEARKLRKIGNYIDPEEIQLALWYSQFLHGGREQWAAALARAIGDFQEAILQERTGRLTPEQMLRLIQMAAVNGHIRSQVRLGVLYAKGQALDPDYERAANWFEAAAKQRDGQAMYYLGEMIKKNYVIRDGSASATSAVSFYVQSALAGHGPNQQRFKDLLNAGTCQDCGPPPRVPAPPKQAPAGAKP